MIAVYREGEEDSSGNFDVNLSCVKPHYHWGNIAIAGTVPIIAIGTHSAEGKPAKVVFFLSKKTPG